jgi:hypothetical protein
MYEHIVEDFNKDYEDLVAQGKIIPLTSTDLENDFEDFKNKDYEDLVARDETICLILMDLENNKENSVLCKLIKVCEDYKDKFERAYKNEAAEQLIKKFEDNQLE